jgi:hypothetical protein
MTKFIPGKYNKGFTPETNKLLELERIYSLLVRGLNDDGQRSTDSNRHKKVSSMNNTLYQ